MNSENIILRETDNLPLVNKNDLLENADFDNNFINIYNDFVSLQATDFVDAYDPAPDAVYTIGQYRIHDGKLWESVDSSFTGVTPGTNTDYWIDVFPTVLAHLKNSDLKLAEGTIDEVTASEIRAFIDAGLTSTTNLSITTHTPNSLQLNSSTGTDVTLFVATVLLAGLLSASDKIKLNSQSGTNTGDQTLLSLGAEASVNKATDFTTINDTLFPTVQAVETQITALVPPLVTAVLGGGLVDTTTAQTISGVKTFSVSPIITSETASTIAHFDGSKNVKSLPLATYPSLVELAHGKGVTSAIQTQINSKQATLQSATNIKTVNGASILGAGDLVVGGSISQANQIYVDSVNGVNSTGRGGISNPYLTLNYAQTDVPTSTGTFSCNTSTNTLLTNISDINYALLVEGQFITGAGIPFNTKILSKDGGGVDAKQVTLTRLTTATASITATWVTTYDIMCLGSFVPTANIYRLGFYYDFETYNASVTIGNFTLFVFTANVLIPFGFKLGRTYGNHVNSSLHNTGGFSGVDGVFDYGNYYSIGNSYQFGNSSSQFNYTSKFIATGEMFDCRFGIILLTNTNIPTFKWIGDAYGLLQGIIFNNAGTTDFTYKGNLTSPSNVEVLKISTATADVTGAIRGNVKIYGGFLQQISIYADIIGTTATIGAASTGTVINLYGKITSNIVAGGMLNIYSLVNGNITVNDLVSATVVNIHDGCIGTITATSGTVVISETFPTYSSFRTQLVIGASGTVTTNGVIRGNFTFTGAGKLTVNGTVFPDVTTGVTPPSIISNGGSVIINPSGVIRYDGTEVACLLTKLSGNLINNGRMVNSSKLFVNYSANNSASKDIVIQNSFTNGNGSNGGVGKGSGNIMYVNATLANTDTDVTIFDGTNTVTISVVGAGKSVAVINAELVTLIKASILLFQCSEVLWSGYAYFIGLQSVSTTATSLVNATTGTQNVGGGLSFVPNDLVGGTENNNQNFNY